MNLWMGESTDRRRFTLPASETHWFDGTVLAPWKPIRILGMMRGGDLPQIWPCCEPQETKIFGRFGTCADYVPVGRCQKTKSSKMQSFGR